MNQVDNISIPVSPDPHTTLLSDNSANSANSANSTSGALDVTPEIDTTSDTSSIETNVLDILPQVTYDFRQVDEMLKESFNYTESNNSMICDIIAMYLKGQKILYTEAKTLCEQRLNYLMLPTICITAVCAVISVVLKEYDYSSTIVSSLNALNFFFLTLINYLKLDAKAEAHRVTAYKFDKLQSRLEFSSGKILFISGESKELPKIISDTEKDVREIKETNQFILPESIRYNYPKLTNINVFAEVKKIQSTETQLINNLKDILNEIITLKLKIHHTVGESPLNELEYLKKLEEKQKTLTNNIIQLKDAYLDIDDQFEDEMLEQRQKFSKRFQLCGCLKS
jgi:hypothetical protein